MGYYLQALIGHAPTLEQHAPEYLQAHVVPLVQGLALIPLTDDLYDEVGGGDVVAPFWKLPPAIEAWGLRLSADALVAYIEADYFGGSGSQSAVAWSHGARVLGPVNAPDAINQVLRLLGVQPAGAEDEFAVVGLRRHRDTADWLNSEDLP